MAVEMEASIPTEIAPALGISVISIFSCWLMVLKIKTNLLECYVYAGRIGAYFGRIGAYFGRGLISVEHIAPGPCTWLLSYRDRPLPK